MADAASPLAFRVHPEAWLLAIGLVGAYSYVLGAWGPRAAPGRPPATRGQRRCFVAGAAALWLATSWPIHDLAERYLFSVHMVQHLLIMYVAAPLLLLGTPAWLWRRLLTGPRTLAVLRGVIRPVVAIVFVGGFIAVAHTPMWVNGAVRSEGFHVSSHVVWLLMGSLMWWPVVSNLPELPHYSYPGRGAYLFAHSIVPTVPASFLTFASTPLYQGYADAPRVWAFMTAGQDQMIAGLLMKLVGGIILWTVIAVLFFRWAHEEQTGGPDFLYWRDLAPGFDTPTTETSLG